MRTDGVSSYAHVDEDICHDVRNHSSYSGNVVLLLTPHQIVRRIHENLPDHFPSKLSDYNIIRHNVGIRPGRSTGIRLEREVREGQDIIHVYGRDIFGHNCTSLLIVCNLGFAGGGYIHSFGAARMVNELVDECLFPSMTAKL